MVTVITTAVQNQDMGSGTLVLNFVKAFSGKSMGLRTSVRVKKVSFLQKSTSSETGGKGVMAHSLKE